MSTPRLSDFDATMIVEGVQEVDTAEEYYAAMQQLINSGLAWKLQGSFGRAAARCIEAGHCYDPVQRRKEAAGALEHRLESATDDAAQP